MVSRRELFRASALVAGGAVAAAKTPTAAASQPSQLRRGWERDYSGGKTRPQAPGLPGRDYTPVITPDNVSLPWAIVDGVKVYHLIAEEVAHEFVPGKLRAKCWGYNGHVHGPTIEAVEGDRVRIYVTNKLPEETTVHWHGVFLPSGMDGVGGLNQRTIKHGETFMYVWT